MDNQLMTVARVFFKNRLEFAKKTRFYLPKDKQTWESITWEQYGTLVENTTLWLRNSGINYDLKASVFASTCLEWAVAGVAIQCARGVLVPIYQSNTPEQTHYVLEHSDSIICFTESHYLNSHFEKFYQKLPLLKHIIVMDSQNYNKQNNLAKDLKAKIITFDEIQKIGEQLSMQNKNAFKQYIDEAKDNDPSSIIYTSGTTGMPKGVVLSNLNVVKNGEDWLNTLGSLIPEHKVDLLWLPLSHIFGWGEIGLGNSLGFETYFTNPKEVLSLLPELQPTIFMSVPAYWEKLYLSAKASSDNLDTQINKLKEITGTKLKFCLSGGAGLKKEVKEFYYKAGMLIIEGYGLTEASPTITMNKPNDFDFDTVGKPFPSVEVKLAEDAEILAKGPNIFLGYYKNPEATKATMTEDGFLKTGDLGEFTNKGFLKIIGRKKDIIVTAGGKNISPQLIEALFLDNLLIENIILYGNEKKYLVAMLTLKQIETLNFAKENNLGDLSFKELCQHELIYNYIKESIANVNSGLASYETIKNFFIHNESLSVEKEQLTPSLKIKRNNIHKDFKKEFESLY